MRKIYTAITIMLFAMSTFAAQAIGTEFISSSAQAQVSETLGTDFLEFKVADQVSSTINAIDHTISVYLPVGADVTALKPMFTLSEGASAKIGDVSQVSGTTVNDFTTALTYTVSNDTLTQNWKVSAFGAVKVTFSVDMTSADLAEGDVVYVTGSYAGKESWGWDMPGTGESLLLTKGENNIWTGAKYILANKGEVFYKYFINASWDNGDTYNSNGDRVMQVGAVDNVINDIWKEEVVTVKFNLDATEAELVEGDVIYVTGLFADADRNGNGWDEPGTGKSVLMKKGTGNMWSATVPMTKNLGEIKYKYFKNASFDNGDLVGDKPLTIADANIVIDPADTWKPVSVTDNKLSLVSLYPNPVRGELTIANLEGVSSITVSNMLGQALVTKNVNDVKMTINTSALKTGVYVVTLTSANGSTRSERIVKE